MLTRRQSGRHVAMVYVHVHFQPITPNEYYGTEFRFPMMTEHTTDVISRLEARNGGKPLSDKQRAKGEGLTHIWRNSGTSQVPPPLPVDHTFDPSMLRRILADMKGS